MERLYKFHRQHGTSVRSHPQLNKKPVDLYMLRNEVASRGGFLQVVFVFNVQCAQKKLWPEVARAVGQSAKLCSTTGSSLRIAYERVVYPYELYLANVGEDSSEAGDSTDYKKILNKYNYYKREDRIKKNEGIFS